MPPPREPRTTTVGKWLLALVVPLSAMAIGSIPVPALIAVSLLAAASCALLWVDPAVRVSRSCQLVVVAFLLLLGVTVLQAVPLPASVSRALSPEAADIWERALSPLHEPGPTWHSLSVAPSATRVQVLRGLFYGCVFLAALRVAALEHGDRFLVRVIVVSTSLMAFVALGHWATTAERVFGLYRPREAWAYAPGHTAPLLNVNHLAAYLGFGAVVSFGTLLSKRFIPRALSGAMAVILAATSILPSSRGAAGALIFGLATTALATFYVRRRSWSAGLQGALLAVSVVAAAVIVAGTLSDTHGHLLSRDVSKLDTAERSLSLVASSPWVGFGRGAFESVFASVRGGAGSVSWTNPEDIVIQWLVEWGIPAATLGFGLVAWALRPSALLKGRPVIGVWVALIATVLHDLVDYHLEVPGIVALVAVAVAVVVQPPRDSGALMRPWIRRIAFFATAGTVVAVPFALQEVGHTLFDERRDLSAAAVDPSVSRDAFDAEIRRSMLRYPADSFIPLMGAVYAETHDGAGVIPWIGRALERNPRFGRAHLVLARSLARGHAAQARLEYRLAYTFDDELRGAVVKEAAPLATDAATALELVPDGEDGVEMLDGLVRELSPRIPSTAVILDAELARRSPASLAPLRRRVDASVTDVTTDAPWCDASCAREAQVLTDELVRRAPEECAPRVYEARLGVKAGDAEAALGRLDGAARGIAERSQCQQQLIQLALANGQTARADRALDQLVKSGCGTAAECTDLYTWAASIEEQRGHYVRAVRLLKRVYELSPDRDDVLEHIGELGDRDGVLGDALDAYHTLSTRHPSDARWAARAAALTARGTPPLTLPSP